MEHTTKNESWGFYGTMQEQAEAAWPVAMAAISNSTGEGGESVRAFLDSRHGRHFADDVLNFLLDGKSLEQAVAAAVQRWMKWRINVKTSVEYGIPHRLPYLTGFVIQSGILEE